MDDPGLAVLAPHRPGYPGATVAMQPGKQVTLVFNCCPFAVERGGSRMTAGGEFRPQPKADHACYLIRREMDRNVGQLE